MGGPPRLVTLGGLVGLDILDILVFLANLVSLGLQAVLATRSGLISLICLGLWLAADRPRP